MNIGFIGVGNMGGPMCRNILQKGDQQVRVFDLNPDAVARCTALGASALVHNLMRMAKGIGYGSSNATAILRVYEDTLGRPLKPAG